MDGNNETCEKLLEETESLRRRVAGLEAREERFRTTLRSIGDAVLATDAEGRVTSINPAAEALTGWTEAEALGQPLSEVFRIVNEETGVEVENPVRRVLREGAVVGLANHTLLIARDGSEHPVADSGAPIRDERGVITGVVLVFRDQTGERASQKALQDSERKFRDAVRFLDEGYYSCTVDGVLQVHNEAFNRILGFGIGEDLKGSKLPDFWQDPEDRKAYLGELMSRGIVRNYLVNAKTIRGDHIVVMANSHLVKDGTGAPAGIQGTFTDFTERKRAEDRVAHLNSVLRAIRNVNQIIVREKDRHQLIRRACENLVETRGLHAAWICVLDDGHPAVFASAGIPEQHPELRRRCEGGDFPECARRALPSPGVHCIRSPADDCGDCPIAGAYHGQAGMAVRLAAGGKTLGLLTVSVPILFADDEDERSLLNEVADDIAFALLGIEMERERRRLEEELVRYRDELEALVEQRTRQLADSEQRLAKETAAVTEIVREMLSGELTDAETERQVLDACLDATGSVYGMIGAVNRQGRYDVTTYNSRTLGDCAFPEALAWEMTTGMEIRGIWGWPMIHGEALLCNDLKSHPGRVGQPAGHVPVECFLGVPVMREGKVAGMVAVANKQGGYTEADERTLTRFVEVMAVSRRHRELLNELDSAVKERTEKLEDSNREMEAFSYSVSHDLRAPLRAIDGFSRILVDDYEPNLNTEGKRICSVIRENTVRMGRLIDDLLAFSRIGRAEMQPSRIDMGTLASSVYHELTTPESRARIDFQVGTLPEAVGDPSLIRQVWMNLLGNAVKFSSKRQRAVIRLIGESSETENIYTVQDNGAGFDMRYVDKLFGVFQRLHSTKEFEGTGVGLSLVHRVIRRHGGRVWAEGETDRGAAIHFTLPRKGA